MLNVESVLIEMRLDETVMNLSDEGASSLMTSLTYRRTSTNGPTNRYYGTIRRISLAHLEF